MSLEELNLKFHEYLEDIFYLAVNVNDPYDRVTIMQWVSKLSNLDDKILANASLRNEYANYLQMTLDTEKVYLFAPFNKPPPEGNLRPLSEVLANSVAVKYPPIPTTGPLEPVISQMSADGKVFAKVKQSPDGGIYCYMAVTPDGFEENKI